MTIIDAINSTNESHSYIKRASWDQPVKLLPTDEVQGFVVIMPASRMNSWNPSKEDILADDWIAVR
nr:MAG TPA: Protein of unknown function (DUF2829) [Caudoviricetes sp.]DAX35879.1 MAG TPA: Protein of unknown function (DUF2829) [Caudoviricetes sp.]